MACQECYIEAFKNPIRIYIYTQYRQTHGFFTFDTVASTLSSGGPGFGKFQIQSWGFSSSQSPLTSTWCIGTVSKAKKNPCTSTSGKVTTVSHSLSLSLPIILLLLWDLKGQGGVHIKSALSGWGVRIPSPRLNRHALLNSRPWGFKTPRSLISWVPSSWKIWRFARRWSLRNVLTTTWKKKTPQLHNTHTHSQALILNGAVQRPNGQLKVWFCITV